MGRGGLEVFKFGVYLAVPALLTLTFVGVPDNMQRVIANRAYVVYPPEGPRPPTGEEMQGQRQKR